MKNDGVWSVCVLTFLSFSKEGRSCFDLSNGRHFYNSYRFLFISHAFKPNATALLELLRRKLLIWRRSEWWGCPKYDTTLLYTSPALMKIDWQKAERTATEWRRLVKKDSQSSAFKRKVKDNKRCILTVISCQIICAYLNANHRRGFRRFAFDVTVDLQRPLARQNLNIVLILWIFLCLTYHVSSAAMQVAFLSSFSKFGWNLTVNNGQIELIT